MHDAVGSHLIADVRGNQIMRFIAGNCDEINECWITDNARFSWDGLKNDRLTAPLVNGKPSSWDTAFKAIQKTISKEKPENIAAFTGNILSAEAIFSFKTFLDILNVTNIDCRTDGLNIQPTSRSSYIMNTPIQDVENADAILLVSCNPRFEASAVNLRIRKAVKNGAKVGNIGAEVNLTYPVKQLGDSARILQAILNGKGEGSGFSTTLNKDQKALIFVGTEALNRKDAPAIMHLISEICVKYDVEYNFLNRHSGLISALDMGFYSNKTSVNTKSICKQINDGKINTLFIHGEPKITTNDIKNIQNLIYIGTHKTPLSEMANIVLPTTVFTEKESFLANCEGRIQISKQATKADKNIKENWLIFKELTDFLGKKSPKLSFSTKKELRQKLAEFNPIYKEIGKYLPTKFCPMGKKGKILQIAFTTPDIENFYISNEIAQSSKNLIACDKEHKNCRTPHFSNTSG